MDTYEQIKNPKSGRLIYIYGDTYQKLIDNNLYTEEYLLSLPRFNTNRTPKSPKIKQKYNKLKTDTIKPVNELNDDVLYNIIMQSDLFDIINLYKTNKQYKAILDEKNTLKTLSVKFNLHHVKVFSDIIKTYKKKMFFILNKLSLVYHTYFGLLTVDTTETVIYYSDKQ